MLQPVDLSNRYQGYLQPIEELVGLLKRFAPSEFVIAGGYPRDFILSSQINDIDIFFKTGSLSNMKEKFEKLKQDLINTGRFDFFIRSEDNFFIEGIFYDLTKEEQKIPKYRIQFINWYGNPIDAIKNFDFKHCQFLIPFLNPNKDKWNLIDGLLTAYDQEALDALEAKKLILSKEYRIGLEFASADSFHDTLSKFEKLFKRIQKFKKRGFSVDEKTKFLIINLLEKQFLAYEKSSFGLHYRLSEPFPRKSLLLEEVSTMEVYDITTNEITRSLFTMEAVAKRVVKEIYLSLDEHPTSILLSESPLVRETGIEILETLENYDKTNFYS